MLLPLQPPLAPPSPLLPILSFSLPFPPPLPTPPPFPSPPLCLPSLLTLLPPNLPSSPPLSPPAPSSLTPIPLKSFFLVLLPPVCISLLSSPPLPSPLLPPSLPSPPSYSFCSSSFLSLPSPLSFPPPPFQLSALPYSLCYSLPLLLYPASSPRSSLSFLPTPRPNPSFFSCSISSFFPPLPLLLPLSTLAFLPPPLAYSLFLPPPPSLSFVTRCLYLCPFYYNALFFCFPLLILTPFCEWLDQG